MKLILLLCNMTPDSKALSQNKPTLIQPGRRCEGGYLLDNALPPKECKVKHNRDIKSFCRVREADWRHVEMETWEWRRRRRRTRAV